MKTQFRWLGLASLTLGVVMASQSALAQAIQPKYENQLAIEDLGSSWFGPGTPSRITQMALRPGPNPDEQYLYLSSMEKGIRRVTYDSQTFEFVAGSLTDVASDIKGLGLGFHGDTLYATEPYASSVDARNKLSRIWRIEDMGFGTRTPIVEGIPATTTA